MRGAVDCLTWLKTRHWLVASSQRTASTVTYCSHSRMDSHWRPCLACNRGHSCCYFDWNCSSRSPSVQEILETNPRRLAMGQSLDVSTDLSKPHLMPWARCCVAVAVVCLWRVLRIFRFINCLWHSYVWRIYLGGTAVVAVGDVGDAAVA